MDADARRRHFMAGRNRTGRHYDTEHVWTFCIWQQVGVEGFLTWAQVESPRFALQRLLRHAGYQRIDQPGRACLRRGCASLLCKLARLTPAMYRHASPAVD